MYKNKDISFVGSVMGRGTVSHNEGLRKYMLGIYNYMSVALLISALVAMFAASSGITKSIFSTSLGMIVVLAPLGLAIWLGLRFHKMSFQTVRNVLFLYSGLVGLSLSSLFMVFSTLEVVRAFFTTAAMFLAASLYGYTTKKDLTPIGSAMIMIMFGLLFASFANLLFKSSAADFLLFCAFVVVFAVMTAYDTQNLKDVYYTVINTGSTETVNKVAVFGAFRLYLDFINMFIRILYIMRGVGRND